MNEQETTRWKTIIWAASIFVGALLLVWGMAEIFGAALPEDIVYVLTLGFLPRPLLGILLVGTGVLLFRVSVARVRRDVAALEVPLVGGLAPGLASGKRPKVVIFAGTEGLKMLLGIAKDVPWEVVGIVPPVGGGVSFARLRRELAISADQIIFPTLYPVEVVAELENGDTLVGEVAIATNTSGSRIKAVNLESQVAPTDQVTDSLGAPELIPLLQEADAVVIGPGSLFTNLIPTLLVNEINEALRKTEARKVFVCNIMTQPNQTNDFTVADHVQAIQDNCNVQLDYVLVASPTNVSEEVLARYEQLDSEIVGRLSRLDNANAYLTLFEHTPNEINLVHGAILVERDNLIAERAIITHGEGEKVVLRHDPKALAEAITSLIQDVALKARLAVSRAVFREYDVRGIAGEQLTERTMYVMGQAFGTFIHRRTGRDWVVLGRDMRLSSETFHKEFCRGLLASGSNVVDLDMVPTPLLQFAADREFADGSAMITASHNPPEFNGVKLHLGTSPISGPELQHIERIVAAGHFISGEGSMERKDISGDYLKFIRSRVTPARPLKVVVDGGNGMGGPLALKCLEAIGCEYIAMYCDPDGRFPNHPPDPSDEANLEELKQRVIDEGADLGVAFDGDGDRLGLVDETGRVVMADQYLAIFARQVLKGGPAKVVFDIRCSQALVDDITAHGGIPIMVRSGNAFILQRMREENARLGGELSGHVFFDDPPVSHDDPIYGMCKLVEFLAESDHPLSAMVDELPNYYSSPEIRIPCSDFHKFEVVEQIKQCFIGGTCKRPDIASLVDVDGVRVTMQDGSWILVRASNTQGRVSVRVEAKTEEDLAALKKLVGHELLKRIPESREPIEEKLFA